MVNKIILIGNLGKDPLVRHIGERVTTSFSMATSETYKNKEGDRVAHTEWHNIVLWGVLAEIAGKYLRKGSLVCIEGKVTYRSYEDKAGMRRYITEVVGRDMTLLPSRAGGTSEHPSSAVPSATTSHQEQTKEEDDLPF